MSAKRRSTREEVYRRMHNVKDYIDSCYFADVTLLKLAEVACMSPHHLLRQFKKHFKVTPHQLVIQKRLEAAALLLKDSSLSLTEVCLKIGFEDVSSFVKLFKKHYGFPPITFRLREAASATLQY